MADIWNYFTRLLGRFEKSSPAEPMIHELINRSTEELADFDFWKTTIVKHRLLNWLADQYAIFQLNPEQIDEGIDFLDTPSSKGFAIHFYHTQYSRRDAQHLFDFLKTKILQLNYHTQISDMRSYNKSSWVETVERHYLKPRIAFDSSEKYTQQYGNVTIENVYRNDQPHQLRFRATVYADRQFQQPFAFKELFNELLT